ncbi:MAG: nucleotide exchange factor GrpE [Bryobacteraceae bacterium]|nr:nucleotide exchange factor GrpE [Bryobacteraceae bacterium]
MEDNVQSTGVETPESPETTSTGETGANENAVLAAEIAEVKQQKAELQDRLMRMQAEFDNFRKRSERERMEYAEYAGEMTVRSLLPMLDDFERALKAAAGAENELVRGIELIYGRMVETLKKQGLEPIETVGQAFDPHLHEAIGRIESADHEDGTVVQEYQKGYRFKGRLLRPSMVQVAVKQ